MKSPNEIGGDITEREQVVLDRIAALLKPQGPHLEFDELWRHACRRTRLDTSALPIEHHLRNCFDCQSNAYRLEQEIFEPITYRRRLREFFASGGLAHRESLIEIGTIWNDYRPPHRVEVEFVLAAAGPSPGETSTKKSLELERRGKHLVLTVHGESIRPAILVLGSTSEQTRILAPTKRIWDRVLRRNEVLEIPLDESGPAAPDAIFLGVGFKPGGDFSFFDKSVEDILRYVESGTLGQEDLFVESIAVCS